MESRIESHLISCLKALSWRLLGSLATFAVTYTVTQDIHLSTAIGVMEFFAKILLFYVHERFWIKLNNLNFSFFGKKTNYKIRPEL